MHSTVQYNTYIFLRQPLQPVHGPHLPVASSSSSHRTINLRSCHVMWWWIQSAQHNPGFYTDCRDSLHNNDLGRGVRHTGRQAAERHRETGGNKLTTTLLITASSHAAEPPRHTMPRYNQPRLAPLISCPSNTTAAAAAAAVANLHSMARVHVTFNTDQTLNNSLII